jgi:hypothetical protein
VMEGDILADTTSAYWTNRLALLDKIMPTQEQTFRYHSHIQVTLDGGTTYYANVTLQDWDCPTEALYPTRTPFMFQWENPYGYWRRVSDSVIVAI